MVRKIFKRFHIRKTNNEISTRLSDSIVRQSWVEGVEGERPGIVKDDLGSIIQALDMG